MKSECIAFPRRRANAPRSACTALALLVVAPALAAAATPVSVPFTTNADGMVALPAMLGSDRPIHVVRFLIGDQPALCSIDTGSPGTTISTRFMAPLGVDPASPHVKKQERRAVESGATITRYWTNVPQLSLVEAPQVASVHPRVSFADIIYDCVGGLDFLHDRLLTLDIARKQMVVR